MAAPTYEHTRAWKAALKLVSHVYHMTQHFPSEEKSGLAGGMRKTAAALPIKLVECWAQETYDDALNAANAGHALLRDVVVQAQIAYHLSIVSRHQLTDLRKRATRTGTALDAMLDDLYEDDLSLAA